jgi:hypothetical protein
MQLPIPCRLFKSLFDKNVPNRNRLANHFKSSQKNTPETPRAGSALEGSPILAKTNQKSLVSKATKFSVNPTAGGGAQARNTSLGFPYRGHGDIVLPERARWPAHGISSLPSFLAGRWPRRQNKMNSLVWRKVCPLGQLTPNFDLNSKFKQALETSKRWKLQSVLADGVG